MPILKSLTDPLVPEEPIRKLQEQMTTPKLDESPWWAMTKGFGAGALEGLRGQTSPLNLAGIAASFIPGAGAAARGGAALAEAPQLAKAGGAMAGLAEAAPQALHDVAEFAPVGGEGAWNAARGVAEKFTDPAEAAYKRILATMGKKDAVVHNSQAIADMSRPGTQQMMEKLHSEARPAFEALRDKGVFSGERTIR